MKIPIFSSTKTLFRTSLPFQEVQKRLQQVFNAPKYPSWMEFFGKKGPQYYQGRIQEKSFKMTRVIAYRNSFMPSSQGKIRNNGKGSEVEIKTGMHLFGMIGIGIFTVAMLAVIIASLSMGLEMETTEGVQTIPVWIFVMVLLPFWGLIGYLHYKEISRTRNFLTELLEASIEPLS